MKRFFTILTNTMILLWYSSQLFAQNQIIISQIYEGASSDKYIEVTNISASSFSFTTTPVYVCLVGASAAVNPSSGGSFSNFQLTSTLGAGSSLLLKNTSAASPSYATTAGTSSTTCNFNGTFDVVFLSTTNSSQSAAWSARTDVVYPVVSNLTTNTNYADIALVRKSPALASTTFNSGDWSTVTLANVASASNTSTNYLGYAADIVLSVEFDRLTIKSVNSQNHISWQTATEQNASHFDIQRSSNPQSNWQTIGTIKAAGNSRTTKDYQFTDEAPLSINYYRLRSVDFDGKESLSNIVSVLSSKSGKVQVYPNPVTDKMIISTESNDTETFSIVNLLGQNVQTGQLNGQKEVSVNELSAGTYFLKVGAETIKFVKR